MAGDRIARPIAMDGRMLGGATTGVGTYARELQRAIAALGVEPLVLSDGGAPSRRALRWLAGAWPGARRASRSMGAQIVAPDIFRRAQIFFDVHRRLLPVRLPGPPGIMHWTYPVPLRILGWRNLYTIHDVIPLLHPELTGIEPRRHRRLLGRIGAAAAGIVTVSQSARAEIVATLGWRADIVHDCGEAAEPEPSPAALPAGLTPGGYLLALGLVETRKNLANLIDAYRASGVALPLVIAGPDGTGASGLAARLAAPGIIRLPYLDEPVARALIGHARALAMVSLAEGFGLPVAEAMALGTPVVASDRGALAETAGGAALAVDPDDVGAIAAALGRVARDDALHARLVAAGRENARRFSRAAFRDRLAALYRRLA